MFHKLIGMKTTRAGQVKLALLVTVAGGFLLPLESAKGDGVRAASPLLQFTSGGHALGFRDDGYFVSNGTYAMRVGFVGANPVAPQADSGCSASTGAARSLVTPQEIGTSSHSSLPKLLSKVTYSNL